METSVSMVDEKWRALMAAARWKGHAAQVTTGRARIPATQPQFGNWNAGNIEIRNTGTVRMAATIRRGRSLAAAADGGWSPEATPPATCSACSAGSSVTLGTRTVAL